jgi:hypothetical protein
VPFLSRHLRHSKGPSAILRRNREKRRTRLRQPQAQIIEAKHLDERALAKSSSELESEGSIWPIRAFPKPFILILLRAND